MSKQIKKARKNIKLLEEADHLALHNLPIDILKPEYAKVLTEQEQQLHHYLSQYADDYLPKSITKEYEFAPYFYYTTNSKKKGIVHRRTRTDSAMFKRFLTKKSKLAMIKDQGLLKGHITPIQNIIEFQGHKPPKKSKKIPKKAKMFEDDLSYIDTGAPIHYMSEELQTPTPEYNMKGTKIIRGLPEQEYKILTVADIPKREQTIDDLKHELMGLKLLIAMSDNNIDNKAVFKSIREKEAEIKAFEKKMQKKPKTRQKKITMF